MGHPTIPPGAFLPTPIYAMLCRSQSAEAEHYKPSTHCTCSTLRQMCADYGMLVVLRSGVTILPPPCVARNRALDSTIASKWPQYGRHRPKWANYVTSLTIFGPRFRSATPDVWPKSARVWPTSPRTWSTTAGLDQFVMNLGHIWRTWPDSSKVGRIGPTRIPRICVGSGTPHHQRSEATPKEKLPKPCVKHAQPPFAS